MLEINDVVGKVVLIIEGDEFDIVSMLELRAELKIVDVLETALRSIDVPEATNVLEIGCVLSAAGKLNATTELAVPCVPCVPEDEDVLDMTNMLELIGVINAATEFDMMIAPCVLYEADIVHMKSELDTAAALGDARVLGRRVIIVPDDRVVRALIPLDDRELIDATGEARVCNVVDSNARAVPNALEELDDLIPVFEGIEDDEVNVEALLEIYVLGPRVA